MDIVSSQKRAKAKHERDRALVYLPCSKHFREHCAFHAGSVEDATQAKIKARAPGAAKRRVGRWCRALRLRRVVTPSAGRRRRLPLYEGATAAPPCARRAPLRRRRYRYFSTRRDDPGAEGKAARVMTSDGGAARRRSLADLAPSIGGAHSSAEHPVYFRPAGEDDAAVRLVNRCSGLAWRSSGRAAHAALHRRRVLPGDVEARRYQWALVRRARRSAHQRHGRRGLRPHGRGADCARGRHARCRTDERRRRPELK